MRGCTITAAVPSGPAAVCFNPGGGYSAVFVDFGSNFGRARCDPAFVSLLGTCPATPGWRLRRGRGQIQPGGHWTVSAPHRGLWRPPKPPRAHNAPRPMAGLGMTGGKWPGVAPPQIPMGFGRCWMPREEVWRTEVPTGCPVPRVKVAVDPGRFELPTSALQRQRSTN